MLLIIIPCLALASVLGLGLVMDSIPHFVSSGGGPNHTPLVILNLILDLICSLQLWKRWRGWKSWEHSIVAGIVCKCIQVMPCYICKEFEEVLKVHTFTKEKHPDCEFNTVYSSSDIRSLASRRSWPDYLRFNFRVGIIQWYSVKWNPLLSIKSNMLLQCQSQSFTSRLLKKHHPINI